MKFTITSATKIAALGIFLSCTASAQAPAPGAINNPLIDRASVVGRTYCVVTNILQNIPARPGFELRSRVGRRMTTFHADGSFSTILLSEMQNIYLADGRVLSGSLPGSDGTGTYTQSGHKLDVTLSSGSQATWYISGDGSTIHGTRISSIVVESEVAAVTTTWTLVESDVCDAELP